MLASPSATIAAAHQPPRPSTAPPGGPREPLRPDLRCLDGGRAPRRLAARARYRRRRLFVAIVVAGSAVLLMVLANAAVASVAGGSPTAGDSPPGSAVAPGTADPAAVHIVQPGETLWSIASEMEPRGDVRATVDQLVESSGGAALTVGQRLVLPS